MHSSARRSWAWGVVVVLAALCGCATSGGGGGEGGDLLAEYELGNDAEFDADISAITQAFNQALMCIGGTEQLTDQENLDGLKQSYDGAAEDFPEFVSETRTKSEARTDEICNTEVGDDPELDALVERLTTAINRGRECRGDEPTRTDEQSLQAIKMSWLDVGFAFNSLLEVAEAFVPAAEDVADEECGEQAEE